MDNTEDSVSMMDILHEQEALDEDAEAVLGGVDEEECTYTSGYRRQPLYACTTCMPKDGSVLTGVCLACANHCHSNHNTVELFTKRNFRCDCGNSKFPGKNPCTLNTEKDEVNHQNKYNQNFKGLYCTCNRPYPDLERPEDEDEMLQCVVCEDWYHSRHLGDGEVPAGDKFGELICLGCVERLPFLQDYTSLTVCVVEKADTDEKVEVEEDVKINEDNVSTKQPNDTNNEVKKEDEENKSANCVKNNSQKGAASDATNDNSNECTRGKFRGAPLKDRSMFLPDDWRSKLCSCTQCKTVYDEMAVPFLTEQEDTISYYEQRAKERMFERNNGRTSRERSVERELDALNSVDRVTRTEMVAEYNTLSTELREYLRKFAETGKVVKGEDIKEFFSGLQARKKRRGNDGMPPTSCKF